MRKIRNLEISILSFVFMIAVSLLVVTAFDFNKITRAEASISVEYRDTYNIGETVAIQSAEFNYQGKKYQANALIRFPNGISYKYDELLLKEPGKYYVEYSALADDNTLLSETKSFIVLADVYSFDGNGEYRYGSNSYLEEEVKGLNVSLGRNSTFKINKPIDISNLTMHDVILKFYATPDVKGAAEAGDVYVRLTDVYDKDRYVELRYRPQGSFQYVYASANNQLLTGLRYTGSPVSSSVEYDGYYYDLSHNNVKNAGHVSRVSMTGIMDKTNTSYLKDAYFKNKDYTEQELFFYNSMECRMDYMQKRTYSQPDGQYAIKRCIVADFDDERTLGGKDPWEGFTTGEVFVSVYAENLVTPNFNLFITDVYGLDITEFTTKNELAPTLLIDTQEYDVNNLPNAIVGKNYELFNVVALDDVDGNVSVSVKVYNSIGASVSINNNSFIPRQSDNYTIEYSAVDSFGNKAVRTLRVKAITRDSVAYELSAGRTEFRAGEIVSVKELALLNPSNLYDLKIIAKNTEQNVEYVINEEGMSFTPLYEGTYKVVYLYTDYCTEQEISYDISVSSSDLVVFDDEILLPKYIIKGMEYPVISMNGYTFVNGTQKKTADFYLKEGNGEELLIEGDTYSVQNDVAFAEYIYKINGREKTYRIPVVNAVNYTGGEYSVDLAKYFYNSIGSFNSVSDSNKIQFEVINEENGVAKLEVINPARLINDFNIGFHFQTGKTNFTGVKVLFESAYHPNKIVEFKFERENGDFAKVFVNNGKFCADGSISGAFRTPFSTNENFNIIYNAATEEFDVSGFIIDANKLLENFDDLFYISFELYGISGNSAINISKVVNQKITNDEYDRVKPVVLYGSFKSFYVLNDEILISAIKLYDFVDPNLSCVVTLENRSGYLTSMNGVKINGEENDFNSEYIVKVETLDRIFFKITCKDFSGNKNSINLPLAVKDVVAPTIELSVKNNLYKVGDTVTVADYLVKDDVTLNDALKVTYYLIKEDGSIDYLSSKSFKIDKEGTYTLYYIVRDEAGNSAYANYLIIVE